MIEFTPDFVETWDDDSEYRPAYGVVEVTNVVTSRDIGPFSKGEIIPIVSIDMNKEQYWFYDEHGAELFEGQIIISF